ncbi:MAG TPA: ABC transporter substrate-binding protein [Acetobacteraceae bacterium]|nr:ABC transporter substrate-binding protein [Acetobacteraceae bacterium]
MQPRTIAAALAALLVAVPALTRPVQADPVVIRIGYPGVGVDNRPYAYGDTASLARAGHYVEDEFRNDPGVKIEWTFFRGAGPAVNEAIAGGQLDFAAGLGDLPSIVGRSHGLATHFLMPAEERDTLYLAVTPQSDIRRIADLAGKRVAEFRGTNLQIAADRVLAAHGLTERNVRFINMDQANTIAALTAGQIDGAFGDLEMLDLQRRGIVRIAYSTKGDDPTFGRNAAVFVTDAFERAHPDLVQRVVTAFVRAAAYGSDERHRTQVFALWGLAGIPETAFADDFAGTTLAGRLTPVIDPYILARYRDQAARAKSYGLLRRDVDIDHWIEPKYLDVALHSLHLEHYWPRYDAAGHKVTDGTVEQTRAAAN